MNSKPKIELYGKAPPNAASVAKEIAGTLTWPSDAVIKVVFWPRPKPDYELRFDGLKVDRAMKLHWMSIFCRGAPQPGMPFLLILLDRQGFRLWRRVSPAWKRTLAHEIYHQWEACCGIPYCGIDFTQDDWFENYMSSPYELRALRFAARLYPELHTEDTLTLLQVAGGR